jgi:Domain of unknown function (DUF6538)
MSPLSQEGQRSTCFLGIIRQSNSFVLPHWYQAVGSMVRVVGLGLVQNEHGVWCVRRKVPKRLEEAVARVQGASKSRQPWLKRSLRTKDEKRARVLAKPVMIEFDRVLAQAEALLIEHPVRTSLTEAEIKQISDYFYALQHSEDEELRAEGIGDDPLYESMHRGSIAYICSLSSMLFSSRRSVSMPPNWRPRIVTSWPTAIRSRSRQFRATRCRERTLP